MIPAGLIRVRRKERYARSDDLLAGNTVSSFPHLRLPNPLAAIGLRQLTKPTFSNSKLRVIRDPASHPKFAELEDKLVPCHKLRTPARSLLSDQ